MKKKLAFIQPNISDGNMMPPLGVLIMAAIIQKKGWKVRYFDERLDSNALNKLINYSPNIVGISVVTASILRAFEIASQIEAEIPNVVIVFGGPHVNAKPEDILKCNAVDFAIIGEGERAINDLCEWYCSGKNISDLKNIKNLCYKNGNGFICNKARPLLYSEELDMLPAPAFSLLELNQVFDNIQHGLFKKGYRILPVMASRGCPSQCTFCCRTMGYKIRYRSPISIVKEIEDMVVKYTLDEIWFEDDNFSADNKRGGEILDLLIEHNLGIDIKFANGIRGDRVDAAILEKMKRAGCYSISFGIESGSQHVLGLMHKNLSLAKVSESVNIAKSMGFLVGANCIIGYPGETITDIKESLDYFMNLNLDSMAIVNLIPFPGTEVRKICEEKGYLTEDAGNYNNYMFNIKDPKILIETEFLSSKTVRTMIKKAYRRMYFSPKRLFKLLKHMKLKNIFRGIVIIFGIKHNKE